MRIFYNYIITLSVVLTVFTNTSWTAYNDLQPNDLETKYQIPNGINSKIFDNFAENVLNFGHTLGLKLAALDNKSTNNEIFSPLSLMAGLATLTLGAKGKSYQELQHVLGIDAANPNQYHEQFTILLKHLMNPNLNTDYIINHPHAHWLSAVYRKRSHRYLLKVVNGLIIKAGYSLNDDYRQAVESIYGTQMTELDFKDESNKTHDNINQWMDKSNLEKISTSIILVSALHFRARWETLFISTAEDNFYPDGVSNTPIRVKMMSNVGSFPFYDAKEYDCRIIGLPYKGNDTTMYVIQPNDSNRHKLRLLQHSLDANKINDMIDNMERKRVTLKLPKMHFKRLLPMKEILNAMNVHDIFENGYSDLSLIGKRSGMETLPTIEPAVTAAGTPGSIESINDVESKATTESTSVSSESMNEVEPKAIAESTSTPMNDVEPKPTIAPEETADSTTASMNDVEPELTIAPAETAESTSETIESMNKVEPNETTESTTVSMNDVEPEPTIELEETAESTTVSMNDVEPEPTIAPEERADSTTAPMNDVEPKPTIAPEETAESTSATIESMNKFEPKETAESTTVSMNDVEPESTIAPEETAESSTVSMNDFGKSPKTEPEETEETTPVSIESVNGIQPSNSNNITKCITQHCISPSYKITVSIKIAIQSLKKRQKRDVTNFPRNIDTLALSNLEENRQKTDQHKSDLYVNDILHGVDFSINERGTGTKAVSLTRFFLRDKSSDVTFQGDTPFLIVVRHNPTKLPLYYGIINNPEL